MSALEQLLRTDPAGVGCEKPLRILDMYAEVVLDGALACSPCRDDCDDVPPAVRADAINDQGATS